MIWIRKRRISMRSYLEIHQPQSSQRLTQRSQRFEMHGFAFVPFVPSLCPLWLKQ